MGARYAGAGDSANLLIEADNLLAIKALLPYYAGRVKFIYIDPPYNTGNEKWVYNDAVNSPEIKAWLGKLVGKEAEDLSRHDKWLCMMYPRLQIAKDLLARDGVIFVSIDDIEVMRLRLIMDEIFKPKNWLTTFIWQTEGNIEQQAKVKNAHEYIVAYAKDLDSFPHPPVIDPSIPSNSKLFKAEIRNTIIKNGPKNPKSEILLPRGFPAAFESGAIKARKNKWPHYAKDVIVADHKVQEPVAAYSGWSSKEICEEFINNGFASVRDTKNQETAFKLTETGAIEVVKKRSESQSHVISVLRGVGTTQQASAELAGMDIKFDYPKPTGLIKYLLSMIKGKDSIVVDFFAGSGTTAHAVFSMNAEDGGHREVILVEADANIAQNICLKRMKAICEGYTNTKTGKAVAAVPAANIQFCNLDEALFDAQGHIREYVRFHELARHVFFTETGEPLLIQNVSSPLLGISNNTAYYLLFNGILGDRRPEGGNILTSRVLASLPEFDGKKVIFGEGSRLSPERLRREGIRFKQVPYQIRLS